SSLPNEIGGVLWFGVDDTYMTVYTPMYCSITEIPYNYQENIASLGEFSWDSIFWVFNAVSNFVYPRYSLAIDDLVRKQNDLEGGYLISQEMVESTALSLLKKSKGECVKYLNDYANSAGLNTYNTWKKFFEFLNMKYMDGVVKDEYGHPKRVGYPQEFLNLIAQEGGESIRIKSIQTDIDANYKENINNGHKYLSQKDYQKALAYFTSAMELKPSEKEPAKTIEKINTIISSIEELHETQFNN
ncbi:MAG: C69 family dipeptidase, partial [Melioribacteraceae bacterium]|nr:C69 family dipeptidase [Melioribacteraceae bacterium]